MKLSFWDILASMVMLGGLALATIFINIFVNPYTFINPFPPPTQIAALNVPTLTPSPRSLPALWTGTPEVTPPFKSATPSPTVTITGTRIVLPTKVPTRTFTRTPYPTSVYNYTQTAAAIRTATSQADDDDNTRPSTPSNLATSSSATDSTPTFTWSASTDSGSGIDYYELSWGTSNSCSGAIYTTDSTSWTKSTLRVENDYYICVGAVDNAGNHSYATGPLRFDFIDDTAPTVPGTPVTSSPTTDTTPTFTWTASSDSGSGLLGYFIYFGTTNSCGSATASTSSASYTPPTLTTNGTYYICVRAYDYTGNTSDYAGPTAFTLNVSLAPVATTNAATDITMDSATLNGLINANNSSTTVTFQYGLSTSYGTTVAATPGTVTGSTNTAVAAAISGLVSNTTYHYRVVGVNGVGTTNGSDMTFTTDAVPSVTTITSDTPDPSAFGASYTVSASVTGTGGTPTGTVTVSDGSGSTCTITLAGGSGSCTMPNTQAGTKTLTATYNGDATFGTSSDTESHVVDKATAVITFGAAPTPTYLGGNFTVSATTTNTDSTVLTYSVVSGPCTWVSVATFSSTGAGTCVVQADGAATTNFTAATETQNVSIAPANQATLVVVVTPSTLTHGSTSALSTTGGSGTGAVTYDAGASTGCSITGTDLTMIDIAGTCDVTATKAADANYNSATSASVAVPLAKEDAVITFAAAPSPTYLGGDFSVSASTTNSDDNTLTYSYVSGPCAFVSGSTFSSSGAGTCVVQADGAASTNFNAASETQSVTIDKADQTITFSSSEPVDAFVGGPVYTPAASSTSGLSVTFSIDAAASSVCSISGGDVSFQSIGTCIVNANQAGNTDYNSAPQVQQSFAVIGP